MITTFGALKVGQRFYRMDVSWMYVKIAVFNDGYGLVNACKYGKNDYVWITDNTPVEVTE